ncbi:two-component system competent response regulator ComA [Paenibacillus sp. W4I10]|uniref:response regulator transcription factor n=1 Tax=Paenibacillus sp. W4I10 TaxID=3042298 RepID=UPI0027850FED|nr:response regulator transcription factor [Paenibacillus sp. W4I10]MDQ0723880.1 two-component system competent response regulator ComA [Paenibacillus sp. W4I10]
MLNVILVDDHKAFTCGMKLILEQNHMKVTVLHSALETLDFIKEQANAIDLYLFDLSMPDLNGIELATKTMEIIPDARIMLFYSQEDMIQLFQMSVQAGIRGFIDKSFSAQQVLTSISMCMEDAVVFSLDFFKSILTPTASFNAPETMLTEFEIKLLQQVAKGETNKQIAESLFMSTRNVEYHLGRVYRKLRVSSRSYAVHKCKILKLI